MAARVLIRPKSTRTTSGDSPYITPWKQFQVGLKNTAVVMGQIKLKG